MDKKLAINQKKGNPLKRPRVDQGVLNF